MLLELPRSAEPLHRRIYLALRGSIRSGRLQPGTRLPSTRALASDLGVSRNSVTLAYEQLTAEGYVISRNRAAIGALLVPGIARSAGDPRLPHRFPLGAGQRRRGSRENPFPVLDDHLGVGHHVVVPGRMAVGAAEGPHDHHRVAVRQVAEADRVRLTGTTTDGPQENARHPVDPATNPASAQPVNSDMRPRYPRNEPPRRRPILDAVRIVPACFAHADRVGP